MTALFICWSGDRSLAAANILARALPEIVPGLKCIVSTQIEPGRLWPTELRRQLDAADAGLVCLTPEAADSPWIHYEAGLLAAKVGSKRGEPVTFTYLLGLEPRELRGPLRDYQSASATREGTEQLVAALTRFAGAERAAGFDAWWRDVSLELEGIAPLPLDGAVPDLAARFRGQTFVEPIPECRDQRWLGRRDEARDVVAELDRARSLVRVACAAPVADVYDELRRLVEGYAMDLKAHFLREERFDHNAETGRLEITGAALSAERRRVEILKRLSELVAGGQEPLMDEAPRFEFTTPMSERKNLIHRKTAELEAGRLMLAEEDFERAAFSNWAFDRIVLYLVLERMADVPFADALRGVKVELEKVRAAAQAEPPHMPLHYALDPLKPVARRLAPDAPDVHRIERALRDVERQIEGRDEGGQMADTIAEIRRLLRQPATTTTE